MPILRTMACFGVGLLIATATHAADLTGGELHTAMNGKTYACKAGGMSFTLSFSKVKASSTEFPYLFDNGKRKISDSYVVTKSGKLKQKSSNKGRALSYDKKGRLVIKQSGGPSAKCLAK